MKKLIFTALVALIAATASAQTVGSANIMGYTKKTLPSGEFRIISNQFFTTNETGVTIGEAFGTSLPDNTTIYAWDGSYSVYTYYDGLGWYDEDLNEASDVIIERGDSVWMKNGGPSSTNSLLSGNIPESETTTNSLAVGFNLIANPYPISIEIQNLGINPSDGDLLYLFDGSYDTYTYFEGLGWYDENLTPADSVEIPVGVGFWYKTNTARSWVAAIPYSF